MFHAAPIEFAAPKQESPSKVESNSLVKRSPQPVSEEGMFRSTMINYLLLNVIGRCNYVDSLVLY